MRPFGLFVFFFLLTTSFTWGQGRGYVILDGYYLPYTVNECGDTILMANLNDVTVSAPRYFKDPADRKRYLRYKRYALRAHPYAVKAVKLYREIEIATAYMAKRHRKKYVKALHQQLKDEFTDELKKMSRTQGMILIKMVENELDTPIYHVIKEVRGGWTARYWSTMGVFFGHHLEQGYDPGNDPVLDAVVHDLPIRYYVPADFETHFEDDLPFKVKKRWKRKARKNRQREQEQPEGLEPDS